MAKSQLVLAVFAGLLVAVAHAKISCFNCIEGDIPIMGVTAKCPDDYGKNETMAQCGDDTSTVRLCGKEDMCTTNFKESDNCMFCEDDLCNSAGGINISAILIFASAVLFALQHRS